MTTLTYGSVCSGIEAATVAWHDIGFEPAWFAEIERFPCALLKHHYPNVRNLGDMTTIAKRIRAYEIDAPDVLVGGTPCQAFSVAGLRGGLTDARGQLTLSYVDLLNAIDESRDTPTIAVWENVPGVLSSKDNAFGCFLGALAGETDALKPTGGKWSNAGMVFGPQRSIAWRILDAQYFGVAQRRRRVFVVASARKDINPAAILFEFDSVRRDTPPSREAGKLHDTVLCLQGAGRTSQNANGSTIKENESFTLNVTDIHGVVTGDVARELTPIECERLQGFPDNYTNVPTSSDSSRYKALGNSMAVPVMRWIGVRVYLDSMGLL